MSLGRRISFVSAMFPPLKQAGWIARHSAILVCQPQHSSGGHMALPKNETEIRQWLARKLGLERVPPQQWQWLCDHSLVQVNSREDLDLLLDEARQLRKVAWDFIKGRKP